MTEAARARIVAVLTIGIPVTDQDRALEFYGGKLGFQTLMDEPVEQLGGRWIVVAPPGSATTLALEPARDGYPAGVQTGIRLATTDAAALHADLKGIGVEVGELLIWPGVPAMFTIRDHDGNGLSVVEVRSGSEEDPR